jgi:hypothetical protein
MELSFAGVGKLSKNPLPLHSLRPQDHFVTGGKYLYQLPYPLSNHLWQTLFAFLVSPSTTLDRTLLSMLWTWLHLLQFCVSNQSLDPDEDSSNKPWRPIPSGLISVDGARHLRWMLLPLCLSVSVRLEAYWQGISLALAFLAHNEFGLHSHLFMRNICNAWGYASFNAGAFAIASGMLSVSTCTAYDRTQKRTHQATPRYPHVQRYPSSSTRLSSFQPFTLRTSATKSGTSAWGDGPSPFCGRRVAGLASLWSWLPGPSVCPGRASSAGSSLCPSALWPCSWARASCGRGPRRQISGLTVITMYGLLIQAKRYSITHNICRYGLQLHKLYISL